jgi:hypothetical protein
MAETFMDMEQMGHVVRDGQLVSILYREVLITSRALRGRVVVHKHYTGRTFELEVCQLLYNWSYETLAVRHYQSLQHWH